MQAPQEVQKDLLTDCLVAKGSRRGASRLIQSGACDGGEQLTRQHKAALLPTGLLIHSLYRDVPRPQQEASVCSWHRLHAGHVGLTHRALHARNIFSTHVSLTIDSTNLTPPVRSAKANGNSVSYRTKWLIAHPHRTKARIDNSASIKRSQHLRCFLGVRRQVFGPDWLLQDLCIGHQIPPLLCPHKRHVQCAVSLPQQAPVRSRKACLVKPAATSRPHAAPWGEGLQACKTID